MAEAAQASSSSLLLKQASNSDFAIDNHQQRPHCNNFFLRNWQLNCLNILSRRKKNTSHITKAGTRVSHTQKEEETMGQSGSGSGEFSASESQRAERDEDGVLLDEMQECRFL